MLGFISYSLRYISLEKYLISISSYIEGFPLIGLLFCFIADILNHMFSNLCGFILFCLFVSIMLFQLVLENIFYDLLRSVYCDWLDSFRIIQPHLWPYNKYRDLDNSVNLVPLFKWLLYWLNINQSYNIERSCMSSFFSHISIRNKSRRHTQCLYYFYKGFYFHIEIVHESKPPKPCHYNISIRLIEEDYFCSHSDITSECTFVNSVTNFPGGTSSLIPYVGIISALVEEILLTLDLIQYGKSSGKIIMNQPCVLYDKLYLEPRPRHMGCFYNNFRYKNSGKYSLAALTSYNKIHNWYLKCRFFYGLNYKNRADKLARLPGKNITREKLFKLMEFGPEYSNVRLESGHHTLYRKFRLHFELTPREFSHVG
jgi:hypothetical protein